MTQIQTLAQGLQETVEAARGCGRGYDEIVGLASRLDGGETLAGLAADLQARQAHAGRLLAVLQEQAVLGGEGLRPLRETCQHLGEQLAEMRRCR